MHVGGSLAGQTLSSSDVAGISVKCVCVEYIPTVISGVP